MVTEQVKTIKSFNPATLELIGEVPCFNYEEVQAAVEQSWQAFDSWRLLDYRQRARLLQKLRKVIVKRSDEIAHLITGEVGKPLNESYMAELVGALDACNWFGQNTESALKDQIVSLSNPLLMGKQSVISFEPIGVIAIISPWNYPFVIPLMSMVMALAVGNTVILKPSEKCPLVGIKIADIFQEAGFPKHVVQVVTGDRQTGGYLSQCRLARIMFTGSVQGGSQVMAQAAKNLTPVSLELGGKDPAIVFPDAPLDWTARALVWGAFTNCGQACASVERVYLIKGKNNEQLIERIVKYAKELKVGSGLQADVDMGPLIDSTQLEKVKQHVEQAKELGAQVLCGGKKREDLAGYFYEPTVLTNVNHSMDVMREETFGPIMPIMIVSSEDEAVELANESDFGLSASVWSSNLSAAEDVAKDLEVGTVFINDALFSFVCPELPWGGIKKSGSGRTHSYYGLIDLVNVKHVSIDSAGGPRRMWWFPYGKSRVEVARGGIQAQYGSFPMDTMAGAVRLVSNFFRKAK